MRAFYTTQQKQRIYLQVEAYIHSGKLRIVFCNKEGPYFKVESLLGQSRVTFEVLRTRLIEQVKLRIHNGEFTERGLSRILGISQSQTHNVLKGARGLRMQLADRILMKLGLSALDLLRQGELDAGLRLKMAEWDRQIVAADERGLGTEEFDWAGQITPRKPVASSEARMEEKEQKTG